MMLIQPKDRNAGASGKAAPQDMIFDVNTAEFEALVLQASMKTPILVDFWAPWCGPCKQLGPVLEAAVNAAGGKVRLAKVNIDSNPELAQALRVQSVPTVFAFFQGQPVTGFTGARPQNEIKTLIDQLIKIAQQAQPGALDIPAIMTQAAQALADNDVRTAQNLYMAVLAQDENNAPAYVGLIRTLISAGALEQAREMIETAPPSIMTASVFESARTALDLAENLPDTDTQALQKAVEKNPADHQARFDLALGLFGAGRNAEAIDALVEIIKRNRTWEEDKARQQLLKFFEALGPAHPDTVTGRRKLSSVLFS